MNVSEWKEEGKRIYGDDYTAWKFVCPKCSRVQSIDSVIEEIINKTYNPKRQKFVGKGFAAGSVLPCIYQECTSSNCDYSSNEEKDVSLGLREVTGENEEGEDTVLFVFNFAQKG